jgi:hypothetical protein
MAFSVSAESLDHYQRPLCPQFSSLWRRAYIPTLHAGMAIYGSNPIMMRCDEYLLEYLVSLPCCTGQAVLRQHARASHVRSWLLSGSAKAFLALQCLVRLCTARRPKHRLLIIAAGIVEATGNTVATRQFSCMSPTCAKYLIGCLGCQLVAQRVMGCVAQVRWRLAASLASYSIWYMILDGAFCA